MNEKNDELNELSEISGINGMTEFEKAEEMGIIEKPVNASLIVDSARFAKKIVTEKASKLLDRTLSITDDGIYHEVTCPICTCKYKKESESIFEKNPGNYQPVFDFFAGKDPTEFKKPITLEVIENHMVNHYSMIVNEIRKKEYVNKINRLASEGVSSIDKVGMVVNMMVERLVGVNSLGPSSTLSLEEVEKIKSAETAKLAGQFGSLMKLHAELKGELKESGDLITIPRSEFHRIFESAIKEATTPVEKRIVKKIMGLLATCKVS